MIALRSTSIIYNLKMIDDHFHTKTYCKIVAWRDTTE